MGRVWAEEDWQKKLRVKKRMLNFYVPHLAIGRRSKNESKFIIIQVPNFTISCVALFLCGYAGKALLRYFLIFLLKNISAISPRMKISSVDADDEACCQW